MKLKKLDDSASTRSLWGTSTVTRKGVLLPSPEILSSLSSGNSYRSDAGADSATERVWSSGSQDLRDHQDAMATTEHEDASDTDIDASNDSAPPP